MHISRSGPLILIVGAVLVAAESSQIPGSGCTAPYLLPNKPFFVVWNQPSHGCDLAGIKLNFSKYGIVSNQDDDWYGKAAILFYNLGAFPYLGKSGPVNGGIPQLANLSYHFNKVITDISTQVPVDFDGVGIIDMESWRPIFSENFDSLKKYQTASIALVQKEHPDWNKTEIYAEAVRQFESAARSLFEGTLNLAQALRPRGKWGFYHFPYCFGVDKDNSSLCGNTAPDDSMAWLWKASLGLFPSVYLYNAATTPAAAKRDYILRSFMETLRVSARFSEPDTPIMMYSVIQNEAIKFFNMTNLGFAIGEPAELGASGVVIWGSSGAFRVKGACQALQKYLDTTLGPYVKEVTDSALACSQKLCSGHGRCVRNDYDLWYQTQAVLAGRGWNCGAQWNGILHGTNPASVSQELLMEMARQTRNGELLQKLRFLTSQDPLPLSSLLSYDVADIRAWKLRSIKFSQTSAGGSSFRSERGGTARKGKDLKFISLREGLREIIQGSVIAERFSLSVSGVADVSGGMGRSRFSDYSCRCLFGWKGQDCSQRE